MSRAAIEGKLRDVTDRIRKVREELAVAEEQLLAFRETADEARLQALVDESGLSAADSRDASRHAEAHTKSRDGLVRSLTELEQARDDLLDRLVLESR